MKTELHGLWRTRAGAGIALVGALLTGYETLNAAPVWLALYVGLPMVVVGCVLPSLWPPTTTIGSPTTTNLALVKPDTEAALDQEVHTERHTHVYPG